ncbi:MAG TPA: preprotein translocase subunit SecY [Candidatus Binatia bacterium]|nr:preprotein translocase subunit SecY [Candidatus Binatia bacterium]
MAFFDTLLEHVPEVAAPTQKRLGFKEKLKWTTIILVLYFALSLVPLFGLGANALQQFEFISIILGANFGSILSLGIGPLVTASIVIQLLNGAGILKFDLTSHEGRKRFQGVQQLASIGFIIFEAAIYVFMGGLAPSPEFAGTAAYFQLQLLLILQLVLGGLLVMWMDQVVSKWGFGSGISLFIAAGVSQSIFIRALSPLPSPTNPGIPTGAIPALIKSLSLGDPQTAGLMLAAIVSTVLVFIIAVYLQAMKVEIPLSFGRVRGQGIRWPLHFVYTSNMPVILVSALLANLQLWGNLLQNWGYPILGTFVNGQAASGFALWVSPFNLIGHILRGSVRLVDFGHAFTYLLFLIGGAIVFSLFWVQTSGLDARSQARQMMSSGLQIPGFRRDERVLERLLDRYIKPLTVMGAISVGVLAGLADVSGALTHGTGILLTVMIVYRLYEDIARQHLMDMNPMMRKFMGGE